MAEINGGRLSSLVDMRTFGEVEKFTGKDEHFQTFRVDLEAAAMLVGLEELMNTAISQSESDLEMSGFGDEVVMKSKVLYAVLVGKCREGRARMIVVNTPSKNGFLAWRRMVAEYEPQIGGRFMGMLAGLVTPDWNARSTAGERFQDVLMDWETAIYRCTNGSGQLFPDALKIATIYRHGPSDVQNLVSTIAASIGDSYDVLKRILQSFVIGGTKFDARGIAFAPRSG